MRLCLPLVPSGNKKRGRWTITPTTSVSTIRTVTPGVLIIIVFVGVGASKSGLIGHRCIVWRAHHAVPKGEPRMPKKYVERQLRLMPLGEIENAYDLPVEGDFEPVGDDPWHEIMRDVTRIFVRYRLEASDSACSKATVGNG